jgi:hypothetical protein
VGISICAHIDYTSLPLPLSLAPILYPQIHPEWKENSSGDFNGVVQLLEELCAKDVLHSYGFSMNIEPFNMHTPAPNRCDTILYQ